MPMHGDDVEFPRVVGTTTDCRIVEGRLIKGSSIITPSLETVEIKEGVTSPELSLYTHPLFHPPDCPVVGHTVDGQYVKGFYRVDFKSNTRHIEGLDGVLTPLHHLVDVVPTLLNEVNTSFIDLSRITVMPEVHTISTSHGVWLVDDKFAHEYVDGWFA
jgi:hypothetical protein